jgi:hypothetical protein
MPSHSGIISSTFPFDAASLPSDSQVPPDSIRYARSVENWWTPRGEPQERRVISAVVAAKLLAAKDRGLVPTRGCWLSPLPPSSWMTGWRWTVESLPPETEQRTVVCVACSRRGVIRSASWESVSADGCRSMSLSCISVMCSRRVSCVCEPASGESPTGNQGCHLRRWFFVGDPS